MNIENVINDVVTRLSDDYNLSIDQDMTDNILTISLGSITQIDVETISEEGFMELLKYLDSKTVRLDSLEVVFNYDSSNYHYWVNFDSLGFYINIDISLCKDTITDDTLYYALPLICDMIDDLLVFTSTLSMV